MAAHGQQICMYASAGHRRPLYRDSWLGVPAILDNPQVLHLHHPIQKQVEGAQQMYAGMVSYPRLATCTIKARWHLAAMRCICHSSAQVWYLYSVVISNRLVQSMLRWHPGVQCLLDLLGDRSSRAEFSVKHSYEPTDTWHAGAGGLSCRLRNTSRIAGHAKALTRPLYSWVLEVRFSCMPEATCQWPA